LNRGQQRKGSVRKPRRKAEETRQDILQTAEDLFRTRGVGKSSVADVAQRLGMSPSNVFKHFHSKTALVDAICDRHIGRMIARFSTLDVEAAPPAKLGIVVERLMAAHLQDIRENPFFLEMIFLMSQGELDSANRYRQLINGLFRELIQEGVEAGTYTCSDAGTASLHVGAAFATVLHPIFLLEAEEKELEERRVGLVALVNAALQNPVAK
jgi:TetR/AcrR family transcriptional repressor of the ameABC operon